MLAKKCGLLCVSLLVVSLLWISGCGGTSAPVSVTITPSSTTVDGTDTTIVNASVTNDHNSAGVTFSVSGGGALSGSTTSSTTYTAPAATSSSQSITITATSIADTSKSGTVTITVPAAPAVTSTSASLAGSVGTAYSVNMQANGGIPPYTWSVASGSPLPTGLALSSSGQLTGAPPASASGTTNVTFNVKDSGTPNALTTSASLAIVIAPAAAFAFTGTMPATATVNTAFNGSAHATGGAGTLTYSLLSGTLPSGTSLNTSTGAVTGTVTAAGAFTFKIGVADAFGDASSNSYTVTVSYPAMAISTGSLLPTAYVNGNYSQTLAASGGTNNSSNYSWTLTGGTNLPVGLNLSAAGVISGKPTGSTGTTAFSVQVTDTVANISTTGSFSITVNAGVSITTTSPLMTGYAGSLYSLSFGAIGGTGSGYTWTVSSGSTLPAGLALSTAGVLSGKPTATGTSSFSITVTDSASNSTSQTFSLTVNAGVSITSSSTLPKGYQGTIYPGATFTATGGTGTGYTWTWAAASGSTLPAGLSLSLAGVVSGSPTAAGNFSIVVTVTDSQSNTVSATVSLTVEAALSISPSTLPSGTVNVAYSQTLSASGGSGTGYTWSTVSNSNPGLNITLSAAGVISGTPTTTGSTTITAQVTDSESHTTSAPLTVTVFSALTVSTTTLPAGNVGALYSQTLAAGGGTGTGYTWTATSSNLSTFGLSLSAAGVVTGTPTATGTASFTAKVTDSGSNSATQPLTIQVYSALSLPAGNSLPAGYTGIAYSGSLTASGGSGTYCWTVTGLPSDSLSSPPPNAPCGYTSNSLPISGTPTTATTVSFSVTLTDTSTNNSIGQAYNISVTTPTPVGLPTPNPTSLPAATVNQSYTGSINATGGVAPYTWSINGTTVTGAGLSLGNGTLTATSTTGNTLSFTGQPSTTGTVTLTNVKVVDAASTSATNTYTIAVNSAGSLVSGHISLNSNCGSTPPVPTIQVAIANVGGTTFTQNQSTDSSGNYTFTGVPNGTYTITPSISGPSSIFYPATYTSVTVNNANVNNQNFNVTLGYTVSGTANYSGASHGRVYINLIDGCGDSGGSGTSLAAPGSFTIRGVSPGSYTLQTWMDLSSLGEGSLNTSDPAGSTANVTVSTANLSGQSVTLSDPSSLSVGTSGPTLKSIAPLDQGVVISFGHGSVSNNNGVELYTSYTVQWATTTSGFSNSQQATFKGNGTSANIWIVRNGMSNITGSLTNGTAYYFQVKGTNASGSSPWTVSSSTVTIGAPSSGANTITGTVTIPGSVTPTGPLYVGLYDQNANIAYGQVIANPSNSAGNNFTVYVPNGSNYFLFGILDQNKDGLIDAGDLTNVRNNNSAPVVVSGNLSGQNFTFASSNSAAAVYTRYAQYTSSGGTSGSYNLTLDVSEGSKLPVAVTLTSGPHVFNPIDIGNYCGGCGNVRFQYNANLSGTTPAVGDAYVVTVTYADGTQDTNVTGNVTGWNGGATVVGASDAATNLTPNGTSSTSTTPTFTWTDSTAALGSSFYYSFYLNQNNSCSGNSCTIWQIPGQNSNSNGFGSSITSLTWGTDPTGGGSTPTVGSLSVSNQYTWSISVQDNTGNQAVSSVGYQP